MDYVPGLIPLDIPPALSEYLQRELQTLSGILAAEQMSGPIIKEYHVEPPKPKHGLVVLADGSNWNPGSGRGLYWYDDVVPAWKFIA